MAENNNSILSSIRGTLFGNNGNTRNGNTPVSAPVQGETPMRKNPYVLDAVPSATPTAVREAVEVAHPLAGREWMYTFDKPRTLKNVQYGGVITPIIGSTHIFLQAEAEALGTALGIYKYLDTAWTHDAHDLFAAAFDFEFEGREYVIGCRAEKFAVAGDVDKDGQPIERTRFVHYRSELVRDENGNAVDVKYVQPLNYRDDRPRAVRGMDPYIARIGADGKFLANRYWDERNAIAAGELVVPLVRDGSGMWNANRMTPMPTAWSLLVEIAVMEEAHENGWAEFPPFYVTEYSWPGIARGFEWAAKHWGKQVICVK